MSIKIRKIKYKTHKCFGNTSRIVDEFSGPHTRRGKNIGDKQILPNDYGQYESDYRTRAEKKNGDDIKLEKNS